MNRKVEKGKTLLVDGPASVTVQSGTAEVFGVHLNGGRKVVIRAGKRMPFMVEETCDFEVALGPDGAIKEVEGDTVPVSWPKAYDTAVAIQKKPVVAMVVGGVDSGKTSFCTYLANRLVSRNCRVAVVDEDLGQSDIGPPCTVAYTYLTKPITDLFNAKAHRAVFVGVTSPSGMEDRAITAVNALKIELAREGLADYVVVNTDGWTADPAAVSFKSRLATVFQPDIIFCLGTEATIFCSELGSATSFKHERIDSPRIIKERDREHRKNQRELGYILYFQGARVKVYNSSHTVIAGIDRSVLFGSSQAKDLLVGLYDLKKQFLGIGIVRDIDYVRKAIKVYTTVEVKPAMVFFGKIRLDSGLHEVPDTFRSG